VSEVHRHPWAPDARAVAPPDSAFGHPAVPRFGHGSRVPGWDEAADLSKDPAAVPDPATTTVPEDLRSEIEGHMANYPDRRSAALPALAAAQRIYGWCSPEAIAQVACVMRLTPAYLDALATFYDMFETSPVGRHSIYVCTNISCSLCGADELYAAVSDSAGEDPEFNVRSFECLGACDIAPMASVDGVYVGPLAIGDVEQLLADVRAGRPVLPDKQITRRRVADPAANTREFPQPGTPEAAQRAEQASGSTPPPADETAPADAPHEPTPSVANPDLDPERAGFGPPMGEEDRRGGPAPIEHAPPVEHAPHAESDTGHEEEDTKPGDAPSVDDTGQSTGPATDDEGEDN
jgi:NADH-quinone oxidoreductase subunit E